ncbi:MAG TPA: hypothetical protein VN043_05350 [Rhodanobacter sp.]|nr:hypothetical protein [Rhodanobacter sp.]
MLVTKQTRPNLLGVALWFDTKMASLAPTADEYIAMTGFSIQPAAKGARQLP